MNPNDEKLPPYSPETEACVLGCCLLDPATAIPEVVARLGGSDEAFYDNRCKIIWDHVFKLYSAGKPVDPWVLLERLTVSDQIEKAGGQAFFGGLPDRVPSALNIEEYVRIVYEHWIRRRVLRACVEAEEAVHNAAIDTSTVLDRVERSMNSLSESRADGRILTSKEIMMKAIDRLEHYHRGGAQLQGLPTGIPYLDKMTSGLGPGQMIIIGGRPGEGKTTLAMNIVEHVSVMHGHSVGVFSLEMSATSLGERLLFQHSVCDYQRFRTGYLLNEDVPKITTAAGRIAKAPIYVDETPSQTVMEIRAKARMMHRKYGVKLLVIDYFQLIQSDRSYRDRQAELGEISKNIKGMAKDLDIPVVLVSAMNRESERDRNRKPQLSDLREAGQLEYDADVIGLLYKPKLQEEDQENVGRQLGQDWSKTYWRANLLIAKQRNGPTGDCELLYRKDCMRFEPFMRTAAAHDPNRGQPKIRPEDMP
jgi:replicative DNA helicase